MIPYSYNMVDMGGIDLAEANRTVVSGIYEKIVEAMNLCGDLILYNWKFAGIEIAPSACSVLQQTDSILINGMIQVTELDQITVIGVPPPYVPVSPLDVSANGTYEAESPNVGFNPVRVAVPGPNMVPYLIAERNGVFLPPPGFDGFAMVGVVVPVQLDPFPVSVSAGDTLTGWYSTRTVTRVMQEGKFVCAKTLMNNGYAAAAFYSLNDFPLADVVSGDYTDKWSINIESAGIGHSTLYAYGGMSGMGQGAPSISVYFNKPVGISIKVPATESTPAGPTPESNFGNAFNLMSSTLKQQFWNAVLQTI